MDFITGGFDYGKGGLASVIAIPGSNFIPGLRGEVNEGALYWLLTDTIASRFGLNGTFGARNVPLTVSLRRHAHEALKHSREMAVIVEAAFQGDIRAFVVGILQKKTGGVDPNPQKVIHGRSAEEAMKYALELAAGKSRNGGKFRGRQRRGKFLMESLHGPGKLAKFPRLRP